jgi:rhamnosyl/mannosyltransferase
MSLVEASIYGKPMITCEIGTGTSFVNIDGVTGYVIPPERPNALASAMHRLWCDPRLRAAMGQEANQRYKELFTGQRMALTYYNVYRELVTK